MTLPAAYFEYPFRRPGMDHARYAYSNLFERKAVQWPGGARVALWIVPTLEFCPLDMASKSVKPPGGLERPYPDYWNYTLRDYGNRVGFARVFRALEERKLQASVAMSSRLAERYPHVLHEVNRLGFELVAHGIDMNHIHTTGRLVVSSATWELVVNPESCPNTLIPDTAVKFARSAPLGTVP